MTTLFSLPLDGLDEGSVALKPAGLVRGSRIFVGGRPAPRGKRPSSYLVRRNDGTWGEVRLKPRLFDPLPRVEYDGVTIEPLRPARWSDYAGMAWPLWGRYLLLLAIAAGVVLLAILLTSIFVGLRTS